MPEYISREAAREAIFVRVGMRTIGTRLRAAYEEAIDAIDNLPAADVAPVVRCKDCAKHYVVLGRDMCAKNAQGSGEHWIGLSATVPDGFCHRGVRK